TTHCYRSYTGYKNGSLRGNRKIIGLLGGPIYINQQLIPCSYYIIFGSGNVHAGTKVQLLVVKKCISKDLFLFGCKVIIRVRLPEGIKYILLLLHALHIPGRPSLDLLLRGNPFSG